MASEDVSIANVNLTFGNEFDSGELCRIGEFPGWKDRQEKAVGWDFRIPVDRSASADQCTSRLDIGGDPSIRRSGGS
jgi:hypothetical protein